MIKRLYPNGKQKAFLVSYDDGVLQDIPFVNLLNKYNLKGTFNLNSQLMEEEFEWVHESNLVVKRLPLDKAVAIYKGHEIASHTLNHPYMDNLSEEQIMYQLLTDKLNLEKIFGTTVKGFAVPFMYYSQLIKECVQKCGFEYARISEESFSFLPQTDYYQWKASIFHLRENLIDFTEAFLRATEELAFCQIVGHTYDLDVENLWDTIENVFKLVGTDNSILPMTTIELVDYLKAMDKCTVTDNYIMNNSDKCLWFDMDGNILKLKPYEKYLIV